MRRQPALAVRQGSDPPSERLQERVLRLRNGERLSAASAASRGVGAPRGPASCARRKPGRGDEFHRASDRWGFTERMRAPENREVWPMVSVRAILIHPAQFACGESFLESSRRLDFADASSRGIFRCDILSESRDS